MQLVVGQIYADKYRIVRPLGHGAMGAVYEGENIRIHRRVAIKTLHPHVADKPDTIQRFEREAQAAGRIGSEHIVEVLDVGELPGRVHYMVMEYLEGATLEQHIRSQGRLSPQEATPIVVQLLDGLEAAHYAGIIHRDLKPANVFLSRGANGDFVKILDFGVSKFNVLNSDGMSMTSTGAVLGTPFYMSPEQAKGSREIDARSDLYAVGVILYEAITGQVPFSAETFNELIFRIVLESPPPVESFVPMLDPAFAAIIRKAMERDPNERFQTAAEFRATLLEWSSKPSFPEMPVAAKVPLGVGATLVMDPPPPAPDDLRTLNLGVPEEPPSMPPLPMGATMEVSSQSRALIAFGLGLLGVLAIGGFVLALTMRTSNSTTAKVEAASTPTASALVEAKAPPSAAVLPTVMVEEPSIADTPSAAPLESAAVEAPPPPTAIKRPPPRVSTPPAVTAAPRSTATPGKRVISTDL